MHLRSKIVFGTLMLFVSLSGCKSYNTQNGASQVKELMPGTLQGYLSKSEMPNSLLLIPPPPQESSVAFTLDQDYARKAVDSKDPSASNQATSDANLSFPTASKTFDEVLGFHVSEDKTPKLYMLMRRILADAALSTNAAKTHYKRERPFMVNNGVTCYPDDEETLRHDGSYPSGHTSIGWAWALVFSEIFPDKRDAILKRGYEFGENRVLCNAHWHSDVEMGRVVGAAVVASLHGNADFQRDLAAAKEEAKRITIGK